jgi:hypothetical protein
MPSALSNQSAVWVQKAIWTCRKIQILAQNQIPLLKKAASHFTDYVIVAGAEADPFGTRLKLDSD